MLDYHPAMVLEDLHELIETLQGRIDVHIADLQKSEALTRYALIDPLLRELGWDTADPNQVRVELPLAKGYAQQGFADYALLGTDGKPRVVVEAKSLGTSLQQAAMQALGYCNALGFPYFAVTDGRFWELYETFRPVPLPEKLVMKLDLKGPIARTCLDSMALWRSGVVDGSMVAGASPVVGPAAIEPSPPTTRQSIESSPEWRHVSDFKPQGGSKPAEVRFPDETVAVALSWADLIAEIVRWLSSEGYLSKDHLPIRLGKANSYFLSLDNDKGNGQPFQSFRVVDGWYMHANYNAAAHMNNARGVIQRVGLNPADFAVRLQ